MIIKTLFSTVIFVFALAWGVLVAVEREPCLQVKKAAAPVRAVMQFARTVDRNLQLVTDRETWLLWSIRADAMSQRGVARLLHGPDLRCPSF